LVEARLSTPADAPAPEVPRYHSLDRLRAVAMLLGILLHALQAHATLRALPGGLPPGGIWLADFIHAWRMPLFFLISGFFSRMMFHRHGAAIYLRRRWQRIGIPLMLGLVTLSPLFVFTHEQVRQLHARPTPSAEPAHRPTTRARENLPSPEETTRRFDANRNGRIDGAERETVERYFQREFGFVPKPPGRPGDRDGLEGGRRREAGWVFDYFGGYVHGGRWFALHYLWFLWYLCVFVVAAPPLARLAARAGTTRAGRTLERLGVMSLRNVLAAIVLAGLSLPWLWAQGGWGLQTSAALLLPFPLFALYPDLPILGYYLLYFLGGWFLHRHAGDLPALAARWRPLVLLGLAAYAASRWAAGDLPPGPQPSAVGADPGQRLLVLSLYAAATGWLTFGLMGWFHARFNQPSARWRYAAEAAFWLYLAHPPVVLLIQAGLTRLPGPWFVHVPIVVATCTAGLLAVYHYGVRHKWIGRLLNGPPPAARTRS
jgi:hypothetical protein